MPLRLRGKIIGGLKVEEMFEFSLFCFMMFDVSNEFRPILKFVIRCEYGDCDRKNVAITLQKRRNRLDFECTNLATLVKLIFFITF